MNTFKPGVHPTFREQYDKITRAYFNDKLQPMSSCACFIGNMLGGRKWCLARTFDSSIENKTVAIRRTPDNEWHIGAIKEGLTFINSSGRGLYELDDILNLESDFLTVFSNSDETEDSLFNAMNSTLDMLRKLHESAGEVTEDYNFQKRALCNS